MYLDFVYEIFYIQILYYKFSYEARRAGSDVAGLPLVQQVRGSIPLGARRGGDVHFLIAHIIIPHNTITLHKQLHLQSP